MHKFLLTLVGCLICSSVGNLALAQQALTPANGEEPTYCEQTVAMHGLLSRAQFQCGYNHYNEQLTRDSAKCFRQELGTERGMEVMKFGMREFDRNAVQKGQNALCSELLKSFPEYIRK